MKNSPDKNIIWKSFENFVTQPLSLLCSKIIRVTNIKTPFLSASGIGVDIMGDSIQINVVNSDGAYNLLSAVAYKKKMQALKRGSSATPLVFGGVQSSPFEQQSIISARKAIVESKKRTIFN